MLSFSSKRSIIMSGWSPTPNISLRLQYLIQERLCIEIIWIRSLLLLGARNTCATAITPSSIGRFRNIGHNNCLMIRRGFRRIYHILRQRGKRYFNIVRTGHFLPIRERRQFWRFKLGMITIDSLEREIQNLEWDLHHTKDEESGLFFARRTTMVLIGQFLQSLPNPLL